MNEFRSVLTSPLKVVVSFEEWKKNNPCLDNWIKCPRCLSTGEEQFIDEPCLMCEGETLINDLYSLYINDLEHDLRLIFAVFPADKIPPRLKAFLDRFGVSNEA